MIKGKIRKSTFRAIYRLLDMVSPVPFDCGTICGAACCAEDNEREMGLFLLPGEEKLHKRKGGWLDWQLLSTEEYEFPAAWQGKVYYATCPGPEGCRRRERPIQCRTFPLKPVLLEEGEADPAGLVFREEGERLALIYSDDALPYCCPLIESAARLDPRFIRATYTVWRRLTRDPLIEAWVRDRRNNIEWE